MYDIDFYLFKLKCARMREKNSQLYANELCRRAAIKIELKINWRKKKKRTRMKKKYRVPTTTSTKKQGSISSNSNCMPHWVWYWCVTVSSFVGCFLYYVHIIRNSTRYSVVVVGASAAIEKGQKDKYHMFLLLLWIVIGVTDVSDVGKCKAYYTTHSCRKRKKISFSSPSPPSLSSPCCGACIYVWKLFCSVHLVLFFPHIHVYVYAYTPLYGTQVCWKCMLELCMRTCMRAVRLSMPFFPRRFGIVLLSLAVSLF